jgi:uncharacterized protein (TIGR03382 family)
MHLVLNPAPAHPASLVGACVVLAWLGMYVHNRADLSGLTFWSPTNIGPAAVWVLLFALWWAFARRRWAAVPLAAWGSLNLVGGFLSVLPMPFLPYAPEQSLRHYGFHLLYAAAQLPLLAIARAELRRDRRAPGAEPRSQEEGSR